nr:efflux pump ustt [Quercus suber]
MLEIARVVDLDPALASVPKKIMSSDCEVGRYTNEIRTAGGHRSPGACNSIPTAHVPNTRSIDNERCKPNPTRRNYVQALRSDALRCRVTLLSSQAHLSDGVDVMERDMICAQVQKSRLPYCTSLESLHSHSPLDAHPPFIHPSMPRLLPFIHTQIASPFLIPLVVACLVSFGIDLLTVPVVKLVEQSLCIRHFDLTNGANIPPEVACKIPAVQSQLAGIIGWKHSLDAIPDLKFWLQIASSHADRAFRTEGVQPDLFKTQLVWMSSVFLFIGGGGRVASSIINTMVTRFIVPSVAAALMSVDLIAPFITSIAVFVACVIIPWSKTDARSRNCISDGRTEHVIAPCTERESESDEARPLLTDPTHASALSAAPSSVASRPILPVLQQPLAVFAVCGTFIRRLGTMLEYFVPQYASERFNWELRQTTWLRTAFALGAIVSTIAVGPFITVILRNRNFPPRTIDLGLTNASLWILAVAYIGAWGAEFQYQMLLGLGEALEPALQGLITTFTDPGNNARIFTFLAVCETVSDLLSGPAIASLLSIGRTPGHPSDGMSFLVVSGTIQDSSQQDADSLLSEWFSSAAEASWKELSNELRNCLITEADTPQDSANLACLYLLEAVAKLVRDIDYVSLQDISAHLQEIGLVTRSSDQRGHVLQLCFIAAGLVTRLYSPALAPAAECYELYASDHGRIKPTSKQAWHRFSKPMNDADISAVPLSDILWQFSSGRGPVPHIPLSSTLTAQSDADALMAPNLNYYTLGRLARIRIQWTDSICQHLEFDSRTKILKLFCHPSFCALVCSAEDEASFLCRFWRNMLANNDWAQEKRPNPSEYLREVICSYRLIFGQDNASRTAYLRSRQTELFINSSHVADPLLHRLCCKDWTKENIYVDMDVPGVKTVYSAQNDFPYLGDRLLELHHYIVTQCPNNWQTLWRDRRDLNRFWTLWLVVYIGALTILLAGIQVVLQIVQIIKA